jgi:hypothetical protein
VRTPVVVEEEPYLVAADRDGLRREAIVERSVVTGCGTQVVGSGHAASLGSVALPARIRFSICRRYAQARSIENLCAC